MQKTLNKVISLLLSCFLASSLLPVTAFAAVSQLDVGKSGQEEEYVADGVLDASAAEPADEGTDSEDGQVSDSMVVPPSNQGNPAIDVEADDSEEPAEETQENPEIEELLAQGKIVENEVIVVYKDEPIDLIEASEESMPDVEVVAQEELTESDSDQAIDIAELSEDTTITAAIENIAENPAVDFVQPNYIYSAAGVSPNDPYFRDGAQYYLTSCGFDEAWENAICDGGVTVAVIDSGCNYSHTDLSGRVLSSLARDVTTTIPSALSAYNDAIGHGTAVSGVIGAMTDNGIGVAGGTYNANVLPIKVFDANRECNTSYLVKGFQYLFSLKDANKVNNLNVLNMSLGGYQEDPALHAQVAKAKDTYKILSVCSGGNGNERDTAYTAKSYPSDYDECLSVTSLTAGDRDSAWSDYNVYKDISVPGEDIWTTSASHGYVSMSGTSLASPVVAPAAALLWRYDPTLSVDSVMDLLKSTASRINGSIRPGNGSAGKLNIEAAMNKLIAQKTGSGSSVSGNKIPKPSSSVTRTFNGGMQQAVSTSSAYMITGVNTATNVGSYTAYVTPNDGYVWSDTNDRSTLTVTWKITPASLSSASVTGIYSRYAFTGGAVSPTPIVTLNGNALAKGEHFEVTYANNVYPGTATLTIQGIGSCTGTRTISYGIGTNAEQFVSRLYLTVLERNPDINGLRVHANALLRGTSAADIAWGFFGSTEFGNRKLTNQQRVDIAYKTMLDRTADAGGRAGWTNKLDVGMSMRSIIAGFSGSTEFRSLCARWGINPGSLGITENRDRNYNITAFVDRLYRNVLDRGGDVGGLNAHTGALLSGTSAANVSWGFFGSTEFNNRRLTNQQRVDIAYKTMLDRNADAVGKTDWTNRLNIGMSMRSVIAGFSGSSEFRNLCARWGINPGALGIIENRDRNYNVTAFVSRLYSNVLNRTGDIGGVNAHTGSLLSGTTAATTAWGFFNSPEFANRRLSNEDKVRIAYSTMLNRAPDASGLANWRRCLDLGMSLYLLIAGFSGSQEFQGLCRSYGITAGTLPFNAAELARYQKLAAQSASNSSSSSNGAAAGSQLEALNMAFDYALPIKCNETTTFTFNATGGNGGYKYMPYSLMVKNGSRWEEAANLTYQSYTTKNTFDFEFTMSGDYRLTVAVIDPPDYSLRRFVTEFTISADQGMTPAQRNALAETKANEVWAACQTAGCTTEYEKALWLHDWVIDNCTYDYDLMYCKDVDLFVDGVGTCEAYHAAYMKLLNKAGIACGRVYDSGHVWTLVRIDGKWYHVDTTHDDANGNDWFGLGDDERHQYFGLDDKIMSGVLAVNKGEMRGRTPNVEATSLDANYFIESGRVKHYSSSFMQDIQTNLDARKTSFELAVPTRLDSARYDLPPTYKLIIYSLVAHDLGSSSWSTNGKSASLTAAYDNGKIVFTATYA